MPILDHIAQLDRVLILGFAREGQSTYRFLRSRFPHLQIGLADQKRPDHVPTDPLLQTFFGKHYLTQSLTPSQYRLVIKSPGVSPHLKDIVTAQKAGVTFTSHLQLFFEICPSRLIIGVSGTKGKSTTASLIHHVLTANHIASLLLGNIGQPALDFLPQITPHTWVVCELSSYQLMDLSFSPHIAVMQNIYPDHLDYHRSYHEYLQAKSHLARFQSPQDFFIYNADNKDASKISRLSPAQKISFRLPDPPLPTSLPGQHNQYNLLPALLIGKILNLPQEHILSAIKTFRPLDTRLQLVTEKNGIKFYSDPLATIPEATIAAIDTLHPHTLIAGGHERHQKYVPLIKKILSSNIKTLILFPDTGQRLAKEINHAQDLSRFIQEKTPPLPSDLQIFPTNSMSEAVKLAFAHTPSGHISLLSPAAPSFTLFKDYKDEHRQYQKAIHAYR